MFQLPHFLRRQLAEHTHSQGPIRDRTDTDTFQRSHRVPDRISHLADLPRAPFVNCHAQYGRVAFSAALAQQLDLRRARTSSFDDDAARETIDVMRVWNPQYLRFVHALDLVLRMCQRGGEIAVVGQDEQPFGIEIEPANRIDVLANTF